MDVPLPALAALERTPIAAAPLPARATAGLDGTSESAAFWKVGDRILGLYEVLEVFTAGGMGLVYRVHHLGWGVDLAVKSPRLDLPGGDAIRESFLREARLWVSLGVHPYVCTCHYVRTLDGIPRAFAEFVDGGSLHDWIEDGRLYSGGHRAALARILDIAAQVAWGVAHAHERGVVHQDLKPANVLLDQGPGKVVG
ncbi:hypothetical protein BL253_24090 [Pseudofrankia asymbiotica]|uniref:non-specific serine/threonine protein kinase n=1 Tax=Pseudofrankia asymbiotica TaxID=1834516 RepID=A0A1V2I5M0_9ACTN|nr:hypothetical protein BL253_24090 [Pseudofrankia asymbiotica]